MLITLAILVIATHFISPILFQMYDRIALNNEIANLQSFIYQIQTKARYQQKNYTLTISQNNKTGNWCLIALSKQAGSKNEVICDCLNIKHCPANNEFLLYHNQYRNIQLSNKSLYPNSFINIDGMAGRLESKCLYLRLNQENEILQLDQWGRIYVIPKTKRSNCKQTESL